MGEGEEEGWVCDLHDAVVVALFRGRLYSVRVGLCTQ